MVTIRTRTHPGESMTLPGGTVQFDNEGFAVGVVFDPDRGVINPPEPLNDEIVASARLLPNHFEVIEDKAPADEVTPTDEPASPLLPVPPELTAMSKRELTKFGEQLGLVFEGFTLRDDIEQQIVAKMAELEADSQSEAPEG